MTKKYGLPTFPLQGGMPPLKRDQEELEWLFEHGYYKSDIFSDKKILKVSVGGYQ